MNDNLTEFKLVGSLFNISHTHGMINASTMVYNPNINAKVHVIECPDIFPIKNKMILIANLFVTTQWYVGSINSNVCVSIYTIYIYAMIL